MSKKSRKFSFQPRVEPLEERALMTWTIIANANVLTFLGDGASDTLNLYDDGGNTISGDGSGLPGFTIAGIDTVVVDAGAGDDTITYNLIGDLQGGVVRKVEVGLRAGDDTFVGTLYNPKTQEYSDFRQSSLLLMSVKAHEGNDDLWFDAGGGVDMDHATMKIGFYGNEGEDRIGMTYGGLNDHGGVSFFAYGGADNDHIRMSLWADPNSVAQSPGGFRAQAFGEDGDDEIYLFIDAPKLVDTWTSLIDGGDGKDFAMTTLDPSQVTDVEDVVFI